MVVPFLVGLAVVLYVSGIVFGIGTGEGWLIPLACVLAIACVIPATVLSIHHSDSSFRRDVRADLTVQHVHVIGVSRDWSAQYLTPRGYCTAHVDSFKGKYIIEHETELCQPVGK